MYVLLVKYVIYIENQIEYVMRVIPYSNMLLQMILKLVKKKIAIINLQAT